MKNVRLDSRRAQNAKNKINENKKTVILPAEILVKEGSAAVTAEIWWSKMMKTLDNKMTRQLQMNPLALAILLVQQEFGWKSVSTLLLKIRNKKWIRIEKMWEKLMNELSKE